jgi:transcriptional antiterminator NusG
VLSYMLKKSQITLVQNMKMDVGATGFAPVEGTSWYAVYVRSRFEKKTYDDLIKKEIDCFLPLIEEVRIWSDRKKKVRAPLFPGYLFVRINPRNKLSVLESDGVVRFVSNGTKLSRVPDEQIDWIRIVIGYPDVLQREEAVSVGQQVEVLAGPFRGIKGLVTRRKGTTRVVIMLESISRSVSVEVAPEYLASVTAVSSN